MTSRTRVVGLPAEVDLGATLRPLAMGRRDPTAHIDGREAWKATRLPSGAVTARFVRRSDGAEVTAWGDGAEELLDRAPAWLGCHDPVDTFDPSAHPIVAELARRQHGLRIGSSGLVVETLWPTVLAQLVTSVEAARSWFRLVERFAEPAPAADGGPPLVLAPRPEVVRHVSASEFHGLGIERKRADVVRRTAALAPSLERLRHRPSAEAQQALCSIRGVGVWTAANVAGAAFGDADAVPVGDYGLPSMVSWFLAGEPDGDDDRMLELLAPFAGHRWRVVRLLGRLGRPPRRAPRAALRDIRRL